MFKGSLASEIWIIITSHGSCVWYSSDHTTLIWNHLQDQVEETLAFLPFHSSKSLELSGRKALRSTLEESCLKVILWICYGLFACFNERLKTSHWQPERRTSYKIIERTYFDNQNFLLGLPSTTFILSNFLKKIKNAKMHLKI